MTFDEAIALGSRLSNMRFDATSSPEEERLIPVNTGDTADAEAPEATEGC